MGLQAICREWHLTSAPTPLLPVPKTPCPEPPKGNQSTTGELLGMGIYSEFYGRSVPNGLLNASGSANQATHQLILSGAHLSLFGTICPIK